MELLSPAFEDNQRIPALFTGDGDDISPPLRWHGVPPETESLALIMEDPDAPGRLFTHWLLYNLSGTMRGVDREVPQGAHFGSHALQGVNDFGEIGYGGPAPPGGEEHRYVFRLFALDTHLRLDPGAHRDALLRAMEGHILAEAVLTGLYERRDRAEIERELEESRREEDSYDRAVHYGATEGEDRVDRTGRTGP